MTNDRSSMLGISAGCEYHVQIYRGVRDFPWKIQTSLIYIVRLLKIGIIPPCMYLEGVMPLLILEDFFSVSTIVGAISTETGQKNFIKLYI